MNPPNPLAAPMSPADAKLFAQYVAMAPFVFQTALCLRDFGVFKNLLENPGQTIDELLPPTKLTRYSLDVLLDAGESAGLVIKDEDGKYKLSQVGLFLEKDPISRVNMNFTQDVCYEGLFHMKEALETNTPAGLKVFGQWPTIYEGLSTLPAKAKESWLEFDHFFSDDGFPRALPIVFKENPKKILDVGGNTGKFSLACTAYNPDVQVTIADHPTQIGMAQVNVERQGMSDRVHFHPLNLLKDDSRLPEGFDLIWMSQLLSCFSEDEVVKVLRKARRVMKPGSCLMIMETFTDNQKFNTARFCLDMTSLYFTVMANGNSRMYRSKDFYKLIEAAELKIVEEHPHLRLNHTIVKCVTA